MKAFLVRKNAVSSWIRHLARDNSVYFPQRAGHSSFRFEPVREDSEIQFEQYRPTIVPPGRKLTPVDETLFRYRPQDVAEPAGAEQVIELVLDETTRILAGVRPCDLKGIDLMDRVNGDGYSDPHYLTRRAGTTIIACDCLKPCDDACFCDATGSLRWRRNADLFLTPIDEDILVEAKSERGLALMQGTDFPVCANADARKAHAEEARVKPFGRQFAAALARLPDLIASQWKSPVWEKHVERCFSCGSCNLVCPTCYCFNIRDDCDLSDTCSGQRTRTWDSCMLPN
ncbi:MAG: 4Fe-4S dicluster domain-containing protein, partial [Alphaproteobacteria bacterium]|nr:4Fe-4S dicluster domain-containing protein [Alphaproteobacteria bacterium]